MIAALVQRPLLLLRQVLPGLSSFILALLSCVPMHMPEYLAVMPNFGLMAVFYWTIYRPDLLPVSVVLGIGLIHDLLIGGLIGLTPLAMIGTYGIVLKQRRVFLGKPFGVTWWGFMITAAAAGFASWLIVSLLALKPLPLLPMLLQTVATVLLFPLVVWFLVRVHRHFVPTIGRDGYPVARPA